MNIEELRKKRSFGEVMWCSAADKNYKYDDVIFRMSNGRDREIFYITADGQMHFSPEFSPCEQAKAFQMAINMLSQQAIFPIIVE